MKQRKVRGPEWGPQVKQTTLLAGPVYIGQAQGEINTQIEEPEPALSPARWGALLLISLDPRALTPERWIFLISFKQNRAVTLSCNTGLSKSYNTVHLRPESCDTPRGLECPSLQIFVVTRRRIEEHTLAGQFDPWVGKISWRRERLSAPVFWPGEFHELYSPWGHKE